MEVYDLGYKIVELQNKCKEFKLAIYGNKKQLFDRLNDHILKNNVNTANVTITLTQQTAIAMQEIQNSTPVKPHEFHLNNPIIFDTNRTNFFDDCSQIIEEQDEPDYNDMQDDEKKKK